MNYNKLVFHENAWADILGRTITIDFCMNEIIVNSTIEGIKWCRIGSRERSTIDAKLNAGRPDEWAEDYSVSVPDGACWTLKLFEGDDLVKESSGRNGYPPCDQWRALSSLADFCSAVTRRYGEYKPPKTA